MPPSQPASSRARAVPYSRGAGTSSKAYQDLHKFALLQFIIARGLVPELEAKAVLKRLVNNYNDSIYVDAISEINADLVYANFVVKTIKFAVDEQRYVAFVNKEADAPSKPGTRLTNPQKEFFAKTLDLISQSPNLVKGLGVVRKVEVMGMRVVSKLQDAEGSAAEAAQARAGPSTQSQRVVLEKEQVIPASERLATLASLCRDGWLMQIGGNDAHFTFGPRTLMELADHILNKPDLPEETRQVLQAMC